MPELTADYSPALVNLIESDEAPIDGIEVGPWFSSDQICQFQRRLSDWQFYFHAGSYLSRVKFRPGAILGLKRYHEITQSRWVSLHIELLPLYVYWLGAHLGINLPPPDAKKAAARFVRTLNRLQADLDLPIILENLASLPARKYNYAADTDVLTKIIKTAGAGLLLDLAHARIAASFQDVDLKTYISRLPLECVKQIHVSGVRERDGHLYDAHESLVQDDYTLLEWALTECKPEMVTLEYFRERPALREQLYHLREIVP